MVIYLFNIQIKNHMLKNIFYNNFKIILHLNHKINFNLKCMIDLILL